VFWRSWKARNRRGWKAVKRSVGQHPLIVDKVVQVEVVVMHVNAQISGGPFSVSISFFFDSPIVIQLPKIDPIVSAGEVTHDAVAAECQF